MIRVVYIAGRYRHWLPNGTYDLGAMRWELADEQHWAWLVAECGCMWFGPLCNSSYMDLGAVPPISEEQIIRRDLAIIRRLTPGYDIILMRPGWDDEPISEGSQAELDEAETHGLLVAHGKIGESAVRAYLTNLGTIHAMDTVSE